MRGMQKGELLFSKKQENSEKSVGVEKILQILRKAYSAQGNKVEFS